MLFIVNPDVDSSFSPELILKLFTLDASGLVLGAGDDTFDTVFGGFLMTFLGAGEVPPPEVFFSSAVIFF